MKMPFCLDYTYKRRKERQKKHQKRKEALRLCPTPGCYGFGNRKSDHFWHYSQHSCPLRDGNIMTVKIGDKQKHSKVIEVPIESFETPAFHDEDKTWHYFIIIGGEGSAELKVYKNSDNIDGKLVTNGQIISEEALKRESSSELSAVGESSKSEVRKKQVNQNVAEQHVI